MQRRAFLRLGALSSGLVLTLPSFASGLADLRKNGVLRVGTSDDYAPFSKATASGRTGFDVELVALLAADLGMRVEYVVFKWPELASRLEQKAFDVAVSGVTMRADRLFFGRFSRPYAVTGAVACVRKEDAKRFGSVAQLDAAGVRIAVNRGGHLAHVARTTFPRATLELLEDNTKLFERLTARAADAVVSDSAEAQAETAHGIVTLPPLTRDRKALYVRSDAPELARAVDDALFKRETDGSLTRLRRKWLGKATPPDFNPFLEAPLADIQLRLDLMPSVGAAKRALGKPIEDREQEARVLARVGTLARADLLDEPSVAALYRELITAAKIIQLAPVLPASPTTTLDALRDAIGALDEHLLATMKLSAPRVPRTAWQKGVEEGIRSDLLPRPALDRLAGALAAVHRVQGQRPR